MEEAKDYIVNKFGKPRILFILALVLTIPFLFLVWMSFYDWGFIGLLDEVIGNEFHEERRIILTWAFIFITRLGDGWFIGLFTILFSLYIWRIRKNTRLAIWYFLTVSVGAGAVNQLVKIFFRRPRPTHVEHLIVQGGYSFPSGHAMDRLLPMGLCCF